MISSQKSKRQRFAAWTARNSVRDTLTSLTELRRFSQLTSPMAGTPLLIRAFRELRDDEMKGLIEDLVQRSSEVIERELSRSLIGHIEMGLGDDAERLSELTEEFREASVAYGTALRGLIAWANARENRIDQRPRGRPRGYRRKTL